MAYPQLFFRLILRPLRKEPLRTALTLLAVTLGVAVVVAIELAGAAATGSFRSSLQALSGDADLEIRAVGGLNEEVAGRLAQLPYPLEFFPQITGYGVLEGTGQTVPVAGWDLIAHAADHADLFRSESFTDVWKADQPPVWVGPRLGLKQGETLRLTTNTRTFSYTVAGVLQGDGFANMANDTLVVMDIAAAQRAFHRFGRLDRITVDIPDDRSLDRMREAVLEVVPDGVTVEPAGSRQSANRRLLSAFRWNLRVLSYISIVVGAFLIYNTISVSVVRRRGEIGVVRAIGASRFAVLWTFLAEAAVFGFTGAVAGLLLGWLMALGAVGLIAQTVEALYISSQPDPIAFTPFSIVVAIGVGAGVSVLAALAPAREASNVAPVEAMARGRREFQARGGVWRSLGWAVVLAACAAAAAFAPPVGGKPLFGYLSALLWIGASALATPAIVQAFTVLFRRSLLWIAGVEAMLAARSLAGSLWRTSVLVGALATAVAMMTSVGIMVGSFRETVLIWMNDRLAADLYLRPAVDPAPGEHPVMDAELSDRLRQLDGVQAIDRFRAYEIYYGGLPATLAGGDTAVYGRYGRGQFLPGQDRSRILPKLPTGDYVIVSEPFANKHGVEPGNRISLSLRSGSVSFQVLGVYYDYSSERGTIIMDWSTLQRHLPDPDPSHVALYLASGANPITVRAAAEALASPYGVVVFPNQDLRREAVRIFDRTFAITYALEAVAIVVAVIGIAGALLALIIDRRRELSLLRFLGAAKPQIRRLILFEAGLLGLLANLTGAALGVVLSLVLIYVINKQSFGWTIQFHVPGLLLAGALVLVFAATILSALEPARAALRLNPIEVIHEE